VFEVEIVVSVIYFFVILEMYQHGFLFMRCIFIVLLIM